ncbi:MAG: hypothetical protein ABFS16_08415 [Bacteroidota bacterium]
MKKSLLSIFITLLAISSVLAQPQLMNYQGVARNQAGQVVSNQQIALQISILTNNSEGPVVYSEIHQITTTKFGVFSIQIGAGIPGTGDFANIAWAIDNHYAKVEMDINGGSNFREMGITQLLSVPYAFHAQTANSLFNEDKSVLKGALPGVTAQTWSLFGNRKTDPNKDKLGTTDEADLVFVTNNIERLRITSTGKLITADGVGLELGGNFEVNGDSTYIGKDLFVGRNVFLNVNDEFSPLGETFNFGDFTVEGTTKLNDSLFVTGPTILNTLSVSGETSFESELEVNGDGYFAKNLVVNDTTFSRNLVVEDNVPDGGYLATFENINDGNGDGIKIKLGKASANNNLGSFTPDNLISEERIGRIKELLDNTKNDIERAEALGLIVADGLLQDITVIVGLATGVGNMVTGFINTELGLPLLFPGITIPKIKIPKLTTPEVDIIVATVPSLTVTNGITIYNGATFLKNHEIFPTIPQINLEPLSTMVQGIDLGNGITVPDDFSLAPIDPTDLEFWGIPDISLIEEVNNPLNNENEFIRFSDSSDKMMGAVRAESVTDWKNNYLFNPIFLYKLYGAITSSTVDKYHAKYHLKGKLVEAAADYYYLGVEYSSGNGDYAEWLERINPDESISAGDIVAVTGGKITKDLTNAEQVMAVSTRPIVLGNTPPEGETYLGNNIAFMGQIPVKIMGAVSTGDYIIGNSKIPGYGIAVSANDMTLEDFKLAVGRAWEDNADKGPKMINTVIGVHNGDYLNILKRYEQKFRESESRMEAVEAKIDILTGLITEKHKTN